MRGIEIKVVYFSCYHMALLFLLRMSHQSSSCVSNITEEVFASYFQLIVQRIHIKIFMLFIRLPKDVIIIIHFKTKKHVLQPVMRRKRRIREQAPAPAYPLHAKGGRKHLPNR